MKPIQVLVIVGPTASGKTALSIALAKKWNGEIISADSRQVYRGLNIGSGKVTKKEMDGVAHHLLDIANPKRIYTAHDFVRDGRAAIADISARGKLPIICGGTGFYIDALLGRIALSPVEPDKKLRARLQKKSTKQLFAMLEQLDSARALRMNESDRHNPVRLIRAIEIARARVIKNMEDGPQYDTLWIGIDMPKKRLENRIISRIKTRLKIGMLAEAHRLHKAGLSYKRMEELGLEYRYEARLLQKKITRKEFETQLTAEIRAFAKRQMTYWKRNKSIVWSSPTHLRRIEQLVRTWIKT